MTPEDRAADETLSLEQRVKNLIQPLPKADVRQVAANVVALVREQIARDIEADAIPNAAELDESALSYNDGIRNAASIARGGDR